MKVGTDGTLLGAWCPIEDAPWKTTDELKVLDVGTGSGLIALMLAQRLAGTRYQIHAIDLMAEAVEQAEENFRLSPWGEHLTAEVADFTTMPLEARYHLIVSNPPYFVDSLKNPDVGRQTARHTLTLSFPTLIAHAASMLLPGGRLALILPGETEEQITQLARQSGLTPIYITRVRTKAGKPVRRVLLCYEKTDTAALPTINELCLMESDGQPRSRAYAALCSAFYL